MRRRTQPKPTAKAISLREALLSIRVPFWTEAAVSVLDELPASLVQSTREFSKVLPFLACPESLPEEHKRRLPQIKMAFRQMPDQPCTDSVCAEIVRGFEMQRLHNEHLRSKAH